jgi:magnesium transporter
VIERLRNMIKTAFVTYGYVTDESGKLLGLITMRDLLFSAHDKKLATVMLADPFCLQADMQLSDAMKPVLNRHYPVYPACDERGRLVGLVRGSTMFEEQNLEISAQPASMVGVEEERLATPWPRSLRFRHPWLQLNLLTAFLAAAVVGVFQGTLDKLVILALFLPVLAGQSGNTGCQALAVTLRGMTLGELRAGAERAMVIKEASLGFLNGALVGLVAATGMYVTATSQHNPAALQLCLAVLLAMIASCTVSGIAGAMIPLTLKKMGFDPATASSIFLTTATDVVSMGCFLGLATILVL